MDTPKYLTVTEFAERVGRSRQAIHRACQLGQLPGARRRTGPGRQPWYIPVACLSLYLDEPATVPQTAKVPQFIPSVDDEPPAAELVED